MARIEVYRPNIEYRLFTDFPAGTILTTNNGGNYIRVCGGLLNLEDFVVIHDAYAESRCYTELEPGTKITITV